MGAVMTGMAMHGGILPVGRHLLRLLGLHARRRPGGRAVRGPRHLLLDPRLGRPRPGRADPPAHRAAGRHAGHARPAGDPAGRRQRDRPGLADRGRQRRADGPDPHPPGPARAGRDGGPGRRRGRPGRLRAGRPRRRTGPGRAHRHRERGLPLPRRRPPAGRGRHPGPRGLPPVVGAVRPPGRRLPGRGPAPRRARPCRSRRPAPSDGSGTPTPRWVSTTSGPRPRARSSCGSSASTPSTSPPGRPNCSPGATRPDRHRATPHRADRRTSPHGPREDHR